MKKYTDYFSLYCQSTHHPEQLWRGYLRRRDKRRWSNKRHCSRKFNRATDRDACNRQVTCRTG